MVDLAICSWNMRQNAAAWARLLQLSERHGVQAALVQEAVPPPLDGPWDTHPRPDDADAWRVAAHPDVRRNFASAIAILDHGLDATPVTPQPLGQAGYRRFAISHPGQFAVADVTLQSGQSVTLISLYGIWDRDDRDLYAEATLHRAISDLTYLLQNRAGTPVVLAGDLNIYRDWRDARTGSAWSRRYDTVFDRLAAYDLPLVGPFATSPLPGCLCGRSDCDHVRTYAHHSKPTNRPYQLDYVFASPSLRLVDCVSLEDEQAWVYSDHLPVVARFDLV